jgi:hypothetical protein
MAGAAYLHHSCILIFSPRNVNMAMSLNFRRFHSAVVLLAAFAAGSANAQNISKLTFFYSNSVPNARAVLLTTEKSDGSPGPVRACTPLLNNNNPHVIVMSGYAYDFIAMSSTNCAPGTSLAGLDSTFEGFPPDPRGIEVKIDASGITAYQR